MESKVDIVVVGAGPAGSIAACEAVKNEANVLLIEKKKEIGIPVQCAEYIPKLLLDEVTISRNCISQEIKGMRVIFPDGNSININSPGYTIHRDIFDKELAKKAVTKGAMLKTEMTGITRTEDAIVVDQAGNRKNIQTTIIIGADGPRSTVGKWINSLNKEFIIGRQCTVPLIEKMEHTEIYFRKKWFGGYGWLFPKGEYAHIGIGIKLSSSCSSNVNRLLDDFMFELEQKGKIRKSLQNKTGGLIPVGGSLETVKDNVMLVGDAAGHTHPITGGGVPQAIICGKLAGKIAAETVQKNEVLTKEYDESWRVIFENELIRARRKRLYLESHWDNLEKIIRKCWPGFHEYYAN